MFICRRRLDLALSYHRSAHHLHSRARSFHANSVVHNAAPSPLETRLRQGLKDAMKAKDRPASTCFKVCHYRPQHQSLLIRTTYSGDTGRGDLCLQVFIIPDRGSIRIRSDPNSSQRHYQSCQSPFPPILPCPVFLVQSFTRARDT